MKISPFFGSVFISLTSAGLFGCAPSNAPVPQKLTHAIDAYASAAIDEFYDYDLDALSLRVDPQLAGLVSIEALETLADSAHETAMPASKAKYAHQYSEKNGVKIITLEYAIPNKVGGETVTVSLSYDKDVCCQLVGFKLAAK